VLTDFKPSDLNNLDRERFASYKASLDFYNGIQWEKQSRYRQLVLNYAKITVDKVTSFLMNEINYSFDPLPGAGAAPSAKTAAIAPQPQFNAFTPAERAAAKQAEDLIYTVLEQNNAQELDYTTEVDTAVLGDGCYKVTWDVVEKRVRITAPDVTGLYAWWKGDDLNSVYKVASRYQLSAEEIELIYKKAITRKIATLTELWTDKEFTLFIDNDVLEKKSNPYGFIPFVIFPNLRKPKQFWGVSDVPPLMESQKELNRAMSQLSRILEVSGNPIAVLEGVTESENIKVGPGQVWNIPPDAKAYIIDMLQGGGVSLHCDYIDLIYRSLHDVSEIPRAAFGGVNAQMSGVALQVELQSLHQKVLRKRLIRTNVYKRRNRLILKLWAKFTGQDLTLTTHRVLWGPVIPSDKASEAQNEQLLVQSGVHSRRTAMDNLGVRDTQLEFDKWLEERGLILKQNNDLKAQSTQGGARERAVAADMPV
jgi:hypothetical protein